MVRLIASLIGAAFVAALAFALYGTVKTAIVEPAEARPEHEFHKTPADIELPSAGLFGKFDMRQVQRGFQVYKEVCSACHSMKFVHFRDLTKIGYSDAQVKAIADAWVVEQPSINPDTGEPATRKNVPSDPFPNPFANEIAAKAANNNVVPPDFSLITKAREDGPDYVHALVTGYGTPSAELMKKFPDFTTPPGLYFNPYFASLNVAMPPPLLSDGQVAYTDGTKASVDQMARDVSEFLTWTAEPNLEARHAAGLAALAFLVIFCFLSWGAYQNVWRDVKH